MCVIEAGCDGHALQVDDLRSCGRETADLGCASDGGEAPIGHREGFGVRFRWIYGDDVAADVDDIGAKSRDGEKQERNDAMQMDAPWRGSDCPQIKTLAEKQKRTCAVE